MSTYGIDLGTTYSCIAKLDDNGNPQVIPNQEDASDTLASAVYFESEGNTVIGNSAKEYVETDGDRVVQFIKREIGKSPEPREFFGKSYTPVEISALILKRLKQMAEDQGEKVENVVITCPAYFGLEERNATKQAGELAGMNVLNIINEPTAAALNYCARKFQEEKNILVYDLGGGTFDVTIVKMSMHPGPDGKDVQKVKVVATGGNDMLGGKDWDDKLYEYILSKCCEENGVQPDDIDVDTKQSIRSQVEKTKKKLSNVASAKVKVNVNGSMTAVEITREDFENMTADLVSQTMDYVQNVLEKSKNVEIDTVLLVGGSTFMPMIRKAVEDKFPGKVQIEDPDRAVAKGAAIYASMIVDEEYDKQDSQSADSAGSTAPKKKGAFALAASITLEDQTPRSFGPGVLLGSNNDYLIDNIIKIGEVMPARVVKTYYTPVADMEKIELSAFESMSVAETVKPCIDAEGNEQETDPDDVVKLLGTIELPLPPHTKRGAEIEVTFEVSASGVYVKAMNKSTGDAVDATLRMESDVDMDSSAVKTTRVAADC